MHSPDWQSSVKTKRCRLADKAVECNLIDVDEALGLDLVCKSKMEDPRRADVRNPFYQDDEHVYYELEVYSHAAPRNFFFTNSAILFSLSVGIGSEFFHLQRILAITEALIR